MAERKEIVNIRCTAKYPKVEDGKKSWCFIITPEDGSRINTACGMVNPNYDSIVNDIEIDGKSYLCVNAHTSEEFDIPIFDGNGLKSEETDIYHDAKVVASITIKEYQFKKKRGLTAYVRGFVLFEQGIPAGVTFESMMDGIDG